MFKKSGKSVHDYFSAMLAGIFGSLAALCAKIGLQESNIIYNTLSDSEYSDNSFLWTLTRGTFICLTIYLNLRMLKSQILSFAYIGASMTIIVAFFVNYMCSLGYEIIFFGDYPKPLQMFGCLLIFAGVYLYKNQLKTT
jgi:drug/metabolite transporter (DMT)-like permease